MKKKQKKKTCPWFSNTSKRIPTCEIRRGGGGGPRQRKQKMREPHFKGGKGKHGEKVKVKSFRIKPVNIFCSVRNYTQRLPRKWDWEPKMKSYLTNKQMLRAKMWYESGSTESRLTKLHGHTHTHTHTHTQTDKHNHCIAIQAIRCFTIPAFTLSRDVCVWAPSKFSSLAAHLNHTQWPWR